MALMRLSKAYAALPNLVGPILTVTISTPTAEPIPSLRRRCLRYESQ